MLKTQKHSQSTNFILYSSLFCPYCNIYIYACACVYMLCISYTCCTLYCTIQNSSGVDVSLVYLDDSTYPSSIYHHLSSKLMSVIRTDKPINPATQRTCIDSNTNSPGAGIFLVNPRIITRSPETDMTVWNERCLVLPPTLTATVLRDSIVQVRYETIDGNTQTITLHGELARAAQHEMDHDRGILILDHVTLEELETDDMRRIEGYGHDARMALAYARST